MQNIKEKIEILKFINNFNHFTDDFSKIYDLQENVNNIDRLLLELSLEGLITGVTNSRNTTQDNPVPIIDTRKIQLTEKGWRML